MSKKHEQNSVRQDLCLLLLPARFALKLLASRQHNNYCTTQHAKNIDAPHSCSSVSEQHSELVSVAKGQAELLRTVMSCIATQARLGTNKLAVTPCGGT